MESNRTVRAALDAAGRRWIGLGRGVPFDHRSRQADLSGADWATLSFDWAMIKTELGDQAVVQISTDGVDWDTLDTFDGPLDHSVVQSASYDISAYIDSDTRIRFLTVTGFGSNDVFFADNVQIEMVVTRLNWR